LTLFSLTAEHTNVDTVQVAPAFKPVHIVTPPGKPDPLIGGPNGPYFAALAELQAKVEAVANAPEGSSEALVTDAMTSVGGAKTATLTLAQSFPRERTGTVVQSLMESPISYVQTALQSTGPSAGALNTRGRDLCDQYNALTQKFPFRDDGADVSMLDLSAFFQPGSGALARFYTDVLQKYVQQQGESFVRRPGTTVTINPAFLNFYAQASAISRSFFESGSQPGLTFTFKPILTPPVSAATLTVDGVPTVFNRNSPEAKSVVWKGPASLDARLVARIDNKDVEINGLQGPWALFHLMAEHDNWVTRPGTNVHTVELRGEGRQVKLNAELNLGAKAPVMRPAYYSPIRCVPEVIR
jgi:type VI protein secretion system component VasK